MLFSPLNPCLLQMLRLEAAKGNDGMIHQMCDNFVH